LEGSAQSTRGPKKRMGLGTTNPCVVLIFSNLIQELYIV